MIEISLNFKLAQSAENLKTALASPKHKTSKTDKCRQVQKHKTFRWQVKYFCSNLYAITSLPCVLKPNQRPHRQSTILGLENRFVSCHRQQACQKYFCRIYYLLSSKQKNFISNLLLRLFKHTFSYVKAEFTEYFHLFSVVRIDNGCERIFHVNKLHWDSIKSFSYRFASQGSKSSLEANVRYHSLAQ